MKNIKKRTKVFIGTLAIISTFFIGSVLGSEVLLVFKGTSTIDEAKELIQGLTQERNTIIDEYNKLDKVATDKIKSLESDINSLKVKVENLTQERNDLQTKYNELAGCEPHSTIVSLQQEITNKENEIKSLKTEISNKEAELKRKDALLQEKDKGLNDRDKRITDLENELTKANNKCKELQDVIGDSKEETKTFTKSDLVD